MGLKINRNEKNEYQLISTVTGKSWHDKEWITLDEAKKTIINIAFNDFVEKAIEIDMVFPRGYSVNGNLCGDKKPSFNNWILDTYESKDAEITIEKKFEEMYDRLKLTFKI